MMIYWPKLEAKTPLVDNPTGGRELLALMIREELSPNEFMSRL